MATTAASDVALPHPLPGFLDGILRHPDSLYASIERENELPRVCGSLLICSTVLLACYGLVMGFYGGPVAGLASLAKLPLLFLSTLAICGPSLYVFNLVLGSKLRFVPMLALFLFAICLTAAMAASLAPVVLFFMLSGSSHRFLVLLHVGVLGVSGAAGLVGMYRGLKLLCERAGSTGTTEVFRVWGVLYGVVGMQMGWLLRPFIGDPALPFSLFRAVEGNFFSAVFQLLASLAGQPY